MVKKTTFFEKLLPDTLGAISTAEGIVLLYPGNVSRHSISYMISDLHNRGYEPETTVKRDKTPKGQSFIAFKVAQPAPETQPDLASLLREYHVNTLTIAPEEMPKNDADIRSIVIDFAAKQIPKNPLSQFSIN